MNIRLKVGIKLDISFQKPALNAFLKDSLYRKLFFKMILTIFKHFKNYIFQHLKTKIKKIRHQKIAKKTDKKYISYRVIVRI